MVQNGYLYTNLADRILQYIRKNELKAGDRLPAERELATLFSSSRSSVREAVRILQNQGIIETEVGRGMFLREDSSAERYSIALWKVDYIELLDVKMVLEFHIIEELCTTITEPELRSLEEPLRKLESDFNEGVFSIADDSVFHTRIRHLYHNQTMVQLLDSLISRLDAYGKNAVGIEKLWLQTIPYHRDLYEAMKMHNVGRARIAYNRINEIDKQGLELSEM